MLLEDAVSWYLGELRALGRSPRTISTYHRALCQLVAYGRSIGHDAVQDLTPALVRGAASWLMDPRRAHANNYLGGEAAARLVVVAARELARWLLAEGVSSVSDLSRVGVPRVPERVQPRLTIEEFGRIESAITRRLLRSGEHRALVARDLALIYFFTDTGLRADEASSLDVADLDPATGLVTVHHGKGHKWRRLTIWDADDDDPQGGPTLRHLRTWLQHRATLAAPAERALWVSHKGRRLDPAGLRGIIDRACAAAGIGNRPPHAFRRAHFTEQYRADPLALPVLVQRMGWSSKSDGMVRTYTRGVELEFAGSVKRPSLAKRWARGSR